MTERYWLELAWLGPTPRGAGAGPREPAGPGAAGAPSDAVRDGVLVEVAGGRFTKVEPAHPRPPEDTHRLAGLTIPGLANCHSHAFHRALRGRTHGGRGSFWTWREQMYALADRLTPDSYFDLARATYREMVASGYTSVGEFHYLHHGSDGVAYDDPNAMGEALIAAAREAGVRIALLDACYLAAGIGAPAEGVQLRFSDATAEGWAARMEGLVGLAADDVVVGAAVHSVRAVPPADMARVASWADEHQAPLHVHLSEQVAENHACLTAYGMTPTALLHEAGALGRRTTAVHATHLTGPDVSLLGASGTHACFCPTTERDLGDGIGPSRELRAAGSRLTLGSDSHAVVDAFEEMRAVEMDERLATRARGHWSAVELLTAATVDGHASVGFGAGRIDVGAPADLVTLDIRSPRTAGTGASLESAVFAATAADVVHVLAAGRAVPTAAHRESVGRELETAVAKAWGT